MEIKLEPTPEPDKGKVEDPLAKMARLTKAIHDAFLEAEAHADEYDLTFTVDPAYGMGGTYYGKNKKESWAEPGWNASSQSC